MLRSGLAEAFQGRNGARLLLVAVILFFLGWDLFAVCRDNRFTASDTTVFELLEMRRIVAEDGLQGWLRGRSFKGPLATIFLEAFEPLVGDPLLAARLLSVLLHVLLHLLVYRVVARRTSRLAGVMAVLCCGTFPMLYGWFRLAFHEPLVAVAVLATLDVALDDLSKPTTWVKLGLVTGLGMLTKLSYPVFVGLPLLYLVLTHVWRRPRHLLLAGLAASWFFIACGWWLVPKIEMVLSAAGLATQGMNSWSQTLGYYLLELPGSGPVLALGVLGAALALIARRIPRRVVVSLLASLLGAVALLVFVFDQWSRYMVPAYPVAMILITFGAVAARGWLGSRLPTLARRAVFAAAGAGLVIHFVYVNTQGLGQTNREFGAGMVTADMTPDIYAEAAETARRMGWRMLEIDQIRTDTEYQQHRVRRWIERRRGRAVPTLPLDEAARRYNTNQPVLVHVTHSDELLAGVPQSAVCKFSDEEVESVCFANWGLCMSQGCVWFHLARDGDPEISQVDLTPVHAALGPVHRWLAEADRQLIQVRVGKWGQIRSSILSVSKRPAPKDLGSARVIVPRSDPQEERDVRASSHRRAGHGAHRTAPRPKPGLQDRRRGGGGGGRPRPGGRRGLRPRLPRQPHPRGPATAARGPAD